MTSTGGPPDDNAKRMMKRFAETTVRRNVQQIKDEFTAIHEHSTQNVPDHSTFSKHPDRNRYQNIFCTESTRVKLNWPQGTKDDYIHANWIKGFPELDKTLIATQAPTQSSIGDFWRMIWQEKVSVIMMLCQLKEQNKTKADLYWPYEPEQTLNRPTELQIENRGVTEDDVKQMRTTKLIVKGRSSRTGEIREHALTHVMWRGWPDKDVPTSSTAAMQLIHKVGVSGVVVVHCSAGIGRTGTIIALEVALRTLLAGRELSIWNIVSKLREMRFKACQTSSQYLFIHYALLQYLVLKDVVTEREVQPFIQNYKAALVEEERNSARSRSTR